MTEAEDVTSSLLASIWLRNLPVVEQRLALLEQAASAAAAGSLLGELREAAADTAHKLAGSLGMYGFDEGTEIARRLELLLDYATPEPTQLSALTYELRCNLFPQTVGS